MLSLFLDTNDPPPLYLDSDTYSFLHARFHEDNHDVNSFGQALELAALHHYHTRSLSAFALSASGSRRNHVDTSSWTSKLADNVSDVLTAQSGASEPSASQGDKLEAISLRLLKTRPSTSLPIGKMGTTVGTDEPSRSSSDILGQIPLFRSRIDLHHAWLARLVLLISYANHFLNEDRLDSFDDLLDDVAHYTQKAAYKLVAGVHEDIYGFALRGQLESKIRHIRSRMNELNSKQLSALLELLASSRSIFEFRQRASPAPVSTPAERMLSVTSGSRTDEEEDLNRLLSKLQGWIAEIGEWRDKEGLARASEGQKHTAGRGGARSNKTQANTQNDENWRRAQAQEEYFGMRRKCVTELCDFLSETSKRLRPQPLILLPDIPFARLWHCCAGTHLQEIIDTTPRCSLITQLNDPFRFLEDYGFLKSFPSSSVVGRIPPVSQRRDTPASTTALRALEASGNLPDVCRAYQLYLNSPRFLNLANWYSAFEQGVRASRAMLLLERPDVAGETFAGNVAAATQSLTKGSSVDGDHNFGPSSPNRRSPRKRQTVMPTQDVPVKKRKSSKSDARSASPAAQQLESHDETAIDAVIEDEDDLQARFALAVNELAIMGLLKGTRRRVEHTTKVIFDLPLPA
ncbi:Origin recognition complex subunit 3 [Tilletia horrida]|uniref:Origin recognition complex subunit 3 n=1 Tax=Tilletia horrida TaxID=155126 RepID=A0AAN6GT57_9BASI|nr:Origin recognition complex subunit 3 [Tilletia horrida]